MSSAEDSQAHYKKRLDKWRSRSTRLFNRAQNLNRTLDRQLATSIKSLENTRDIAIRRDQEKIWMVAGSGLKVPKYTKEKDQPAYLGKQMNATLPTPQELSSLLPNKKAKERTQSRGYYMQLSRRRLSSMQSGDLNIYHYRKALESLREKEPLYSEVIQESDGEDLVDGKGPSTPEQGTQEDDRWAAPTDLKDIADSEPTMAPRPTTAFAVSTTKPKNQPNKRPKTSLSSAARNKRRESVPNATALMLEQAQDPKNKVLRTNFLDMYKRQAAKHERRMSAIKEFRNTSHPGMLGHSKDTDEEPLMRPDTAIGLSEEGATPAKDRPAAFMADTASSARRMSLKQRVRRTSVAALSGMSALHGEVKSLQSFRKFKQETLGVVESDIPSVEDLEEGELFDEMRKCRYIRWGQDEQAIEELNEDQPLTNQLKSLTIDKTKKPKKFLKKAKEAVD